MILPPYITFKHECVYVCQTSEPHYISAVVQEPTEYWVQGYRLWLKFAGSLGGNRLVFGDDLDLIVQPMLDFYVAKVQSDPSRYKKFIM